MPEYLAPGVYVEEIPFNAKPIDGVSTSTDGLVRPAAVKARRRRAGARFVLSEPLAKRRMAVARALAQALSRDLYRIDLSAVVSKYIGETEKNLRRLLRRAEKSEVLLFFDEADALFGKRTDVEDAHDRFARSLLEQVKAFRGVALLAVKRKTNLDPAFIRRARCIVIPSNLEKSKA